MMTRTTLHQKPSQPIEFSRWEPWALLGLLGIAELISDLWAPVWGIWLHIGLTFLLFLKALNAPTPRLQRFYGASATMPLVRVVSFAISPTFLPGIWYYVAAESTLLMAAIVAIRVMGLPAARVGLRLPKKAWGLSLIIALSGVAVGWGESHIIHPAALSTSLTFHAMWGPALLLIVFTGLSEELLFRGVIQTVAVEVLGPWGGILYTAVGWSLLHIGWNSFGDVLYVFSIGLLWCWVRQRTQSILATTLAHGFANIYLFLVAPFVG